MRRQGVRHVSFAKLLRKRWPVAIRLLWARLRNWQCSAKFRRHHLARHAIADFACLEHRLIIELDGFSHSFTGDHDRVRQDLLESEGWTVMRFSNDELLADLEGSVRMIQDWISHQIDPDQSN